MPPFRFLLPLMPLLASAGPARAQDAGLDALVHAYPAELAGYDARNLIWRDGTRMPLGAPAKGDLAAMLLTGSIRQQMAMPYDARDLSTPAFGADADPGRIRDTAFFDKMYGDCRRGEVAPRLVPVAWLPHLWGGVLRVTTVNGVAEQLAAVSRELEAAPPEVTRYLYPPGGGYNCRAVADAGQASMHGWGAAVDINVAHSDYWHWHRMAVTPRPIPAIIVETFARYGFIWGGKWSHYDTMHFEYRPELLGETSPTE